MPLAVRLSLAWHTRFPVEFPLQRCRSLQTAVASRSSRNGSQLRCEGVMSRSRDSLGHRVANGPERSSKKIAGAASWLYRTGRRCRPQHLDRPEVGSVAHTGHSRAARWMTALNPQWSLDRDGRDRQEPAHQPVEPDQQCAGCQPSVACHVWEWHFRGMVLKQPVGTSLIAWRTKAEEFWIYSLHSYRKESFIEAFASSLPILPTQRSNLSYKTGELACWAAGGKVKSS